MKRDQITKDDFPSAGDGYDRASVDAHLAAVAAWAGALEAQITALEVEREALRRQIAVPGSDPAEPVPADPDPEECEVAVEEPQRSATERSDDEVSARLLVTRLALEGSEREQMVARLTDSYELDDAASLVDDVLARLA